MRDSGDAPVVILNPSKSLAAIINECMDIPIDN